MSRTCDKCGQPLPDQSRRDPPLPPLDFPALVTIHDLPPDAREMATVKVVDGKERGVKYRFFEVKPPLQPKDLPDDRTG